MTALILVKHSLPEIVPGVPAPHWHLSEEGQRRCQALAEKLEPYQPEALYTSREPKAIETAQWVGECLGLSPQIAEGLHEHERYTVNLPSMEAFRTAVAEMFAHPDRLVLGEETANQALLRYSQAVEDLREQNPSQSLLVISHGTVISLWVARHFGVQPFPFWQRLGLPSFVVISLEPFRLEAVVENIPNP